jgi:hypothetical protein
MFHSEYAVGWTTLALIVAGIAQGKGRKGLNWFLLSALGGPLALLVLLFFEPVKE